MSMPLILPLLETLLHLAPRVLYRISRLWWTVTPSVITVLRIMILPVNGSSCFMSIDKAFHPRFQTFLPLLLHPGRTV